MTLALFPRRAVSASPAGGRPGAGPDRPESHRGPAPGSPDRRHSARPRRRGRVDLPNLFRVLAPSDRGWVMLDCRFANRLAGGCYPSICRVATVQDYQSSERGNRRVTEGPAVAAAAKNRRLGSFPGSPQPVSDFLVDVSLVLHFQVMREPTLPRTPPSRSVMDNRRSSLVSSSGAGTRSSKTASPQGGIS